MYWHCPNDSTRPINRYNMYVLLVSGLEFFSIGPLLLDHRKLDSKLQYVKVGCRNYR